MASRKETIASQGGDGVVVGTVRHERYVLGQYWSRHVSIHATKSNLSPQHTSNGSLRSKRAFSAVNPAPLCAAQAENVRSAVGNTHVKQRGAGDAEAD